MHLLDVLMILEQGMHVQVHAETIWPRSCPVKIVYMGTFEALRNEHTQTSFCFSL